MGEGEVRGEGWRTDLVCEVAAVKNELGETPFDSEDIRESFRRVSCQNDVAKVQDSRRRWLRRGSLLNGGGRPCRHNGELFSRASQHWDVASILLYTIDTVRELSDSPGAAP